MTRWQAIIFDLDDTLYPESSYVLSGFRAVAAWAEINLGLPAALAEAELQHLYRTGVRGDTFNLWLAAHKIPVEPVLKKLVAVYREHEPTIAPFAGMAALLDRLQASYRLGVVSDGWLTVQQKKFAALGLASYFQAVIFSDVWGRQYWKPNARPFEAVCERLAVPGEAAVYVADNPVKDFLGARRLGLFTIRFRFPGGEYAQLEPESEEHAPQLVVRSLGDLEQFLARV